MHRRRLAPGTELAMRRTETSACASLLPQAPGAVLHVQMNASTAILSLPARCAAWSRNFNWRARLVGIALTSGSLTWGPQRPPVSNDGGVGEGEDNGWPSRTHVLDVQQRMRTIRTIRMAVESARKNMKTAYPSSQFQQSSSPLRASVTSAGVHGTQSQSRVYSVIASSRPCLTPPPSTRADYISFQEERMDERVGLVQRECATQHKTLFRDISVKDWMSLPA